MSGGNRKIHLLIDKKSRLPIIHVQAIFGSYHTLLSSHKREVILLANSDVRLALFSGINFTGRRIIFRRGGVAVRDLGAFRFNNVLSSFRLRNVVNRDEVTLVLFSLTNFQGRFRIFRGSQNVANLGNFGFNNVTSSFILVGRRLTDAEITQIQLTGIPPRDILVIRQ
jgi:hypothetical protein